MHPGTIIVCAGSIRYRIMKKLLMLLIALCGCLVSEAQKQVVVMKKDRVIQRYNQGDFIRYSISKPKNFKYDQIVELTDTTIITRNDTIPYYKVKLIDTQGELQSGITLRKIGYFSITAGVILPLADLINVELVQDQESSYSLDRGVGITSAALITTGAALLLIKKPYLKLQFKNRLMIVRQDSPLYKAITLPPSNAFTVPTR
jgi:hypothetical protein